MSEIEHININISSLNHNTPPLPPSPPLPMKVLSDWRKTNNKQIVQVKKEEEIMKKKEENGSVSILFNKLRVAVKVEITIIAQDQRFSFFFKL